MNKQEKSSKMKIKNRKNKPIMKVKQKVAQRKERLRRKGKALKPDTKYTGRKRRPKF